MMKTTRNNTFKNIYKCNINDFNIPKKCMVIFRSYSWPFKNIFSDHVFDLFQQTFKGKGLVRNGVNHEGSFSMYGPRTSKQSNGNLLMHPINVDKHCYFQENMNLTLLPHVMSFIKILMKQSICSGNTCGESMMSFYKKH